VGGGIFLVCPIQDFITRRHGFLTVVFSCRWWKHKKL